MAQSSRTGTITPITVTTISRFKSFKPSIAHYEFSSQHPPPYGSQNEEEPLGRVLHQGFFVLVAERSLLGLLSSAFLGVVHPDTPAFSHSALVFASVIAAKAGAPKTVATATVRNARKSLIVRRSRCARRAFPLASPSNLESPCIRNGVFENVVREEHHDFLGIGLHQSSEVEGIFLIDRLCGKSGGLWGMLRSMATPR